MVEQTPEAPEVGTAETPTAAELEQAAQQERDRRHSAELAEALRERVKAALARSRPRPPFRGRR